VSRYTPSAAGKGSNRREGKGFEDSFDKIFGNKTIERGRYIQDPTTGKLVKASEYDRPTPAIEYAAVHGDFDSFVSPIDHSVIDDRGKLREHNKRHGVTNAADYSPEYLASRRKQAQPTRQELKQERFHAIRKSLHQHGIYD